MVKENYSTNFDKNCINNEWCYLLEWLYHLNIYTPLFTWRIELDYENSSKLWYVAHHIIISERTRPAKHYKII
jgi:hypothetical protein